MPIVILLVLALLLLSDRQAAPQSVPSFYYPPPGYPPTSPGARTIVPPAGPGAPSTRTQIETGVGALVGAGAGLYLCAGSPACAALGAGVGGTVAPYVSEGVEAGAVGVAHGAEAAYKATLGRLF